MIDVERDPKMKPSELDKWSEEQRITVQKSHALFPVRLVMVAYVVLVVCYLIDIFYRG